MKKLLTAIFCLLAMSLISLGEEKDAPKSKFVRLENGNVKLGEITVHRDKREISFPAKMNLNYGLLEVLIATPEGRLHESLLKANARPLHLQTALYLLDAKNGPRLPDAKGFQGDLLDIDIVWEMDGKEKTIPIENWIWEVKGEKKDTMTRIGWVFVGSKLENGNFLADDQGNIALTYSLGDTVLDTPHKDSDKDTTFYVNEDALRPADGTDVTVILKPRKDK